jgi:hypothetical protein
LAAKAVLFVRSNQAALWKMAYFGVAALLVTVAAWNRFSLPQDPLADPDAYLWPAVMKLSGGPFPHLQGLNFLYPGMVYLILRTAGDFRVISVAQHFLGLAAGALFLTGWNRLADFFPRPLLSRVAHQAIGLFGAGIYLLSTAPLWFEMAIRPDAVCMFFQILIFWLAIQFFYYRIVAPNSRKAVIYATGATVTAFLAASIKPSFTLMALFAVVPVIWLVTTIKGNLGAKLAFFGVAVSVVMVLTFAERHLRRNDPTVKIFLPETLFVFHAKIIHAQMVADLEKGETAGYPSEWLRRSCDELGREIRGTHELYPEAFPVLGFQPDYLHYGTDSLLDRWRHQLGDDGFVDFLRYWYWHSLVNRPLAFVEKIAGQLRVFYSTDCPAFRARKKWPLSSWSYTRSLSALSQPPWLVLLSKIPAGSAFLERTRILRSKNIVIHQNKAVQVCHVVCARTFLPILLVSVPLAAYSLLRRSSSENSKWAAFWVLFFYAASFGNILGVSVVHSMEVPRYSTVLFISALFAQVWAIRWLIEIGVGKYRKSP